MDSLTFRPCTTADLSAVLDLQERIMAALPSPGLLRRNTPEMFLSCLQPPHVTLGAWQGALLAALAILYFPQDEAEDLSHLLETFPTQGRKSANYKLCVVDVPFRGRGLQAFFGRELEKHARAAGTELLCATVSPDNPHSRLNLERLGYKLDHSLVKYGAPRELYYKPLL